jgi:hypothetical protein
VAGVAARLVRVDGSPTRPAWWRPGGGVEWWCRQPVWGQPGGGRPGGVGRRSGGGRCERSTDAGGAVACEKAAHEKWRAAV